MNIGIIIYSQTGNTLAVAEKMKETCIAAGHTAEIGRITVEKPDKVDETSVLADIPSVAGYDALIFGAPVQAFSLCAPMVKYLKQLPDIRGVPTGCFVTQGLPKNWMGGNRTHKTMRRLCMAKGTEPTNLGIIHTRSDQCEEQTADVVSAALKFAATQK